MSAYGLRHAPRYINISTNLGGESPGTQYAWIRAEGGRGGIWVPKGCIPKGPTRFSQLSISFFPTLVWRGGFGFGCGRPPARAPTVSRCARPKAWGAQEAPGLPQTWPQSTCLPMSDLNVQRSLLCGTQPHELHGAMMPICCPGTPCSARPAHPMPCTPRTLRIARCVSRAVPQHKVRALHVARGRPLRAVRRATAHCRAFSWLSLAIFQLLSAITPPLFLRERPK